jgi:isopentenyl-diphosphate delta-isomerase
LDLYVVSDHHVIPDVDVLTQRAAIADARAMCPDVVLIGSGGVRSGVDAAKAIRLGADVVGQAAGVLGAATQSSEAVIAHFEVAIRQLRTTCFCTGSANLAALRSAAIMA